MKHGFSVSCDPHYNSIRKEIVMILPRNFIRIFFCVLLFVLFAGCSGSSNPTTPNDLSSENRHGISVLPLGVSEVDEKGIPISGYGTLGIFEVSIDTQSMQAEINSLRNTSSTDVLEVVDITNFLLLSPCTDCVKIEGVEFNADGNVVVYIGIKHPFPPGNPLLPPTGRNRADLHVFNIEGLVVAEAASSVNFSMIGEIAGDFRLVNSDGYSPYLDNVLDDIFTTTASIHPYILHFDDYSSGNYDPLCPTGFQSVTDPPPSGYLVMAMGCDYDVQAYEFKLVPGENIDFIYAVGCTYAISAETKIQRFSPEYRIPQHLKKAASEVNIRIIENLLEEGDISSSATLAIDIVDLSHGVAIGDALDEMKADSSVGSVRIEVPGVATGVIDVPLNNTGGSGHDPSDPLTYTGTVTNSSDAATGMYLGLVKVSDTYPAGVNTLPILLGNDGIERVEPLEHPLVGLFAIPEFATYQVFEIEVYGEVNEKPVAILLPDDPEIFVNNPVNFDGTTSYDTDGTIVLYEFDYDWDGV